MLPDISHDRPDDRNLDAPVTGEQLARRQAIRQIERRRRFRMRATIGTLLMVVLTVSWVFAEYHNAGGWPTQGFSHSSSGLPRLSLRAARHSDHRTKQHLRRPAPGTRVDWRVPVPRGRDGTTPMRVSTDLPDLGPRWPEPPRDLAWS